MSEREIKITPEQQTFIDTFCSKTPCFLSARAGTGKTTTIRLAFEEAQRRGIPHSALSAIAFNKANQEDLAKALGLGVKVSTLHSLGLSTLKGFLPKLEISQSKLFDLTKISGVRRNAFGDTMRLVSSAKNWGLVPKNKDGTFESPLIKKSLFPDNPETWEFLRDYYELFEADIELARNILKESNKEALKKNIIDFDDMVYLPVILGLSVFGTELMVVDEAQDLSPLNLALLKKTPSKISYVGDPFQCIYSWRGAAEDTVESLGLPVLPLTESFRCSGNIIKEARKYVSDIRTSNEAGLPVVRYFHLPDFSKVKPSAILARKNSTLISLAINLRSQKDQNGKPLLVYILGRDFAKTLVSILDDLKGTNSRALTDSLINWSEKMLDKYPHREGEIKDYTICLKTLLSEASGRKETEKLIESLFTDKPSASAWTLSTIHRAKGKEWDTVFLIDWVNKNVSQSWMRKEDRNLRYVGITRAKNQLFIIDETALEIPDREKMAKIFAC